MPKSRQRSGLFPQIPGACRKDSIALIQDQPQRKYIGSSRAVGIFDKAKQLRGLTGYEVSVIVQPPNGELPTLMFATNDSLFANMATLVQRFGPRGEEGGSKLISNLTHKNRLASYLKSSTDQGLIVPQSCIAMLSSTPARQTMLPLPAPMQEQEQATNSPQSSGLVEQNQEQQQHQQTDMPLELPELGPEMFINLFEPSGWRMADLKAGFAPIPPSMLAKLSRQQHRIGVRPSPQW